MQTSGGRIAKNTMMLYVRMLLLLGVTLYTSRVVLEVLGVDGYGIYNLVGGVVVLFSFLNGAMTAATQRYLCVSIGGSDSDLPTQPLFSSSIIAHLWLVLLLYTVAETLGLWFIKTELIIPHGRMHAAMAVYQWSIVSSALMILRIPYSAAILSYEKMDFFAWSSVIEAILKLAILWPLKSVSYDKLVLYSILIAGINLAMLLWYAAYATAKLPYIKTRLRDFKGKMVLKLFSFAGWNSCSSLVTVGSRQGQGFILNIFFGVAVNASIGIMTQVSSAVYGFISNFQTAVNPPLIKAYAAHETDYTVNLMLRSGKYSLYLLLILAMPIIFNMTSILEIWLDIVPPYTSQFCTLSLIALFVNTIGGPVWTVIQASGHIHKYQLIISAIIATTIPAFWIVLKVGYPPYATVWPTVVANIAVVIVGYNMVRRYIDLSVRVIMRKLVIPCLVILAFTWTAVSLLHLIHFTEDNLGCLILRMVIDLTITATIIFVFGVDKQERGFLISAICKKLLHR